MAITVPVVTAKAAESVGELAFGPLQVRGEVRDAGLLVAGSATASAVVVHLALNHSHNAGLALTANAALVAVASAGLWVKVWRSEVSAEGLTYPTPGAVHALLWSGLIVGTSNALLSLLASVPQFFVAAVMSTADVSRYAVLLYVIVFGEMIMNAVSQAWLPSARRVLEDADHKSFIAYLYRSIRHWTALFAVLAVLLPAMGVLLVPAVFGSFYQFSGVEAVALGVSIAILPSLFGAALAVSLMNRYRQGLGTSLVAVALSVVGCALLVPVLGTAGALIVNAVGLLVRALASLTIAKRGA